MVNQLNFTVDIKGLDGFKQMVERIAQQASEPLVVDSHISLEGTELPDRAYREGLEHGKTLLALELIEIYNNNKGESL